MTLRELADLLGLSPTTVSRALNGYPEVSAKTRERVEAAARTHGYVPNHMAQRLATGRSRTIAHVVGLGDGDVVNPVFSDFIAGAGETYAARGYNMLVSFVPDRDEPGVYRQLAAQRSVDGVLLHSPRERDPRPALLRALNLPYLIHGRTLDDDGRSSWIDIDNRACFEAATRHLLSLGHRRIAFLNGPRGLSFAERRRRGVLAAFAAAGVTADESLLFHDAMTEDYGHRQATDLLRQADAPSAILTSSVVTALGVRRAAAENGIGLGQGLSVIAHDDELSFLPNAGTPPVFTATRSSVRAAGHRAAELLIDQIETGSAMPVTELWPVPLVEGRSTGPLPSA